MNAVSLLARLRAAGGDARLTDDGRVEVRHLAGLDPELRASLQAQHRAVASALVAERFAAHRLDWRPHGPGFLVVLEGGARLHALPRPCRRWALTRRDTTDVLQVVLRDGTLAELLEAAASIANQSDHTVAAS